MNRAMTKMLLSYPLSIMKCFFEFFWSEVGVAKHFSAKIDSLLSLLWTFAWKNINCRSLKDNGKSLYDVMNLKHNKMVRCFFYQKLA